MHKHEYKCSQSIKNLLHREYMYVHPVTVAKTTSIILNSLKMGNSTE